MLDTKRDRLDYGQMLIPPAGYRLERAVGATYSADLNTLLSIPVALVYARTLEGTLDPERFEVLEAIKSIAKRVTVYHQQGCLHVPARYNRLYAFLEDMLVPVRPDTAFTSFHPKVWVLRYVAEEAPAPEIFRLLVMSRNLTFDRSWDVAVCLEGEAQGEPQSPNQPICDFLQYLHGMAAFPESDEFFHHLERVKFTYPPDFRRPRFHPSGFPGHYAGPIQEAKGERAVVLSPFVDDKTLSFLVENVGELHLFSRREELARLNPETLSRCASCQVISRWVVEGERQIGAEDGGQDEARDQDLHAKLFVIENQGVARWFLGSANATQAAMTRNIEFLAEFTGRNGKGLVNGLLDELLGKDREKLIFEAYNPEAATGEDTEKDDRNAMRRLEYELLDVPVTASLSRSGNQTNYDLLVEVDLRLIIRHPPVDLTVRPLNRPEEARKLTFGQQNNYVFENIAETELTRFLVYEIRGAVTRQFLVKVDVKGMPGSRGDSIFKSIVNSREKFFQYLAFLLAEEPGKSDWHDEKEQQNGNVAEKPEETWQFGAPVFEQLLVAASRNPDKLKQVDDLITRLRGDQQGEDIVVPEGFLDLWAVFREYLPERSPG